MPICHGHVFKCDFTHKNPYIWFRQNITCGARKIDIKVQMPFMQENDFDNLTYKLLNASLPLRKNLTWVVELKGNRVDILCNNTTNMATHSQNNY